MKLQPSKQMWDYYTRNGGKITALGVASTIADILAGYHVAYSAAELCLELKLIALAPRGKYRITKQGKLALSAYLHAAHHKSTEPLIVVPPDGIMTVRMELPDMQSPDWERGGRPY